MKVGIVLPRGMHFSADGATSIDVTARDLVLNSKFRHATYVVGAAVGNAFEDVDFRPIKASSQNDFMAKTTVILREDIPDVIIVHQHSESANHVARTLPGVPVLLHRHGLLRHKKGILSRWRKRKQLKHLAGIIFVSDFLRRSFLENHPEYGSKCVVVYNGIDTSFWTLTKDKKNQITFVGRAREDKGIYLVLNAFKSIKPEGWQLRLVLAVRTIEERKLADRIHSEFSSTDRIVIQENLTQTGVRDVLAKSKIVAVPSIVEEGFHRVIIEAQACGCTVIASAYGGAPEAGGNVCQYIQSASVDEMQHELKAAFIRLTSNEQMMNNLGKQSRLRIENEFSIQRIADRYDQLISNTVA
ncbi:MAG: glycosyltransferase family 4 protein [Roseibium sp.]